MSFLLKQAVNTLEADIGSVNDQVSTLTIGAPTALQTLTQLAKALNDDASFASTVANTLATKADAADVTASLGLKANTVETQPLLTSDPQSTGVSVLSNNAIRTIFGVSPLGVDLYFDPFDPSDHKHNNIQLSLDSTYTTALDAKANAVDVAAALELKADNSTVHTSLSLLAPIANPTFTGTVVGVTKSAVGLGNVDNTTDAGKPRLYSNTRCSRHKGATS